MTPDRWNQISQLYEAARARPASDRAAFVAEACGNDEALRGEVLALLEQPTSPSMLEGLTPTAVARAMDDQAASNLTGRRFGVWCLRVPPALPDGAAMAGRSSIGPPTATKLMAVPVRAEGRRLTIGRAEPLFDARPRLESSPVTFYDVSAETASDF
jgi:hypothetical protein